MQELEKILEEMNKIKDGNRKEKIYAKYPPNGKDQEILNAYSQGYEDGTDNFYNAIMEKIRECMTDKDTDVPINDGWISVEEWLPEKDDYYIATLDGCLVEQDNPFVGLAEFENGKWEDGDAVIAWQPLPEPYRPERGTKE